MSKPRAVKLGHGRLYWMSDRSVCVAATDTDVLLPIVDAVRGWKLTLGTLYFQPDPKPRKRRAK